MLVGRDPDYRTSMREREIYFDPRDFERGQFGAIISENFVGPLSERITCRKQRIGLLGDLWNWEEKSRKWVKAPLKITDLASGHEADVSYLVQRLARDGYKYILWMSPSGGPAKYPESRLVVYRTDEVTEGGVEFSYRAICGYQNEGWGLNVAQGLLIDGGKVYGSEMREKDEVRRFPVGLSYRGEDIWGYLKQFVGEMEGVWEVLAAEQENIIFQEKLTVAEAVENGFGDRLGDESMSDYWAMVLGAEIEGFVRRQFGIRLIAGGNHGMSNEAALGLMARENYGNGYLEWRMGVVPFEMRVVGRRIYTEAVRRNGKYYCPVCGEELGEGRAVCGKCGVRVRR